jgi:hypothetical protein
MLKLYPIYDKITKNLIKDITIKKIFLAFYQKHPYLTLEQAIDYFSIYGGVEDSVGLEFFDDIFTLVERNFVDEFETFANSISPSYLLDEPYSKLLTILAKGEGKLISSLHKAKLGESSGMSILQEMIENEIIYIEKSRENPLKIHPKYKLKKELRRYKIQDKARFTLPFYRFWFGFVMPFYSELQQGKYKNFMEYFKQHYERLRSLVFEQLSKDLLVEYFKDKDEIISCDSYWDKDNEFDILAVTKSHKIILAECKYKDRKVCKNELNKLKQKALYSSIKVDKFVLFSKSGFSKELISYPIKDLILFDLDDFITLLTKHLQIPTNNLQFKLLQK